VNQPEDSEMPDTPDQISTSHPTTKPYLIRAIYEWCTDNGYTPYVAVVVDESTRVPNEFVKDRQIVLNVSFEATSNLKMGNDLIEFAARFGGVAREIMVPIARVAAIYARENGHGMGFEVADTVSRHQPEAKIDHPTPATAPARPAPGGKPKLKVVK
jgi:stringent starvation protein B